MPVTERGRYDERPGALGASVKSTVFARSPRQRSSADDQAELPPAAAALEVQVVSAGLEPVVRRLALNRGGDRVVEVDREQGRKRLFAQATDPRLRVAGGLAVLQLHGPGD